MNVTKLELVNFRNYEKIKLENLSNINLIIGLNGSGKTSILESIYVLSLARSFKSNLENNLIKHDKNTLKIKAEINNFNKIKKLEYSLNAYGKKTKINGNLKKKISDYIFQYKVVLFAPQELQFIVGSPNTRRNYLNISLSQLNKSYMRELKTYNTLIKNKNDYYKKMYVNSNLDSIYLDIIDNKISEVGYEIYLKRVEYVEKINKYLKRIFKKFNKSGEVYLKYSSHFDGYNSDSFKDLLKKNRKKEINYGLTKTGIHRDELEFLYNGVNVKDFCSQGIQKLVLLTYKLAELEVLINDYYEKPILLLDDLFSELDTINQNKVLQILNKDIQIFVTNTDLNNIKKSIIKKANIIDLGSEKYGK